MGRKIGHDADSELLDTTAGTDITDHHKPGMDADTRHEGQFIRRFKMVIERLHRTPNTQAGMHRPARGIFVNIGVAEIRQESIT